MFIMAERIGMFPIVLRYEVGRHCPAIMLSLARNYQ